MKTIDVRIRIAILWALLAAAGAFSLLLGLLVEPTALEEALAGELEGFATDGWVGYFMAVTGIIPLALAVMTLQFDTKGTRYTNLIAGLLFGALTLFDSVYHFVDGGEFYAWVLVSAAFGQSSASKDAKEFIQIIEPGPERQHKSNGEEEHAKVMHVDLEDAPVEAKKPREIVMQHQTGDSDHLVDRLVFTEITGIDNNTFRRGDRSQSGDNHFPCQNHKDSPGRNPVERDQHDQRSHYNQLVCQRIKKFTEYCYNTPFAS